MSKVILDASALLALVKNEPGGDMVANLLGQIVMTTVNVSEVAATLLDSAMSLVECQSIIEPFINSMVEFDTELAFLAATLRQPTKPYGLSLGDRACLALGLKTGLPIYTADQIWANLPLPGVEIKLIR